MRDRTLLFNLDLRRDVCKRSADGCCIFISTLYINKRAYITFDKIVRLMHDFVESMDSRLKGRLLAAKIASCRYHTNSYD